MYASSTMQYEIESRNMVKKEKHSRRHYYNGILVSIFMFHSKTFNSNHTLDKSQNDDMFFDFILYDSLRVPNNSETQKVIQCWRDQCTAPH